MEHSREYPRGGTRLVMIAELSERGPDWYVHLLNPRDPDSWTLTYSVDDNEKVVTWEFFSKRTVIYFPVTPEE